MMNQKSGPHAKKSESPRFRRIHGDGPRSSSVSIRKANVRRPLCFTIPPKSRSSKPITVDQPLFPQFEMSTASQRKRNDDISLVSLPSDLIPKSVPKMEKSDMESTEHNSFEAQFDGVRSDNKINSAVISASSAGNINIIADIKQSRTTESKDIKSVEIKDTKVSVTEITDDFNDVVVENIEVIEIKNFKDAEIEDKDVDIKKIQDVESIQIIHSKNCAKEIHNENKSFADKNETKIKNREKNDTKKASQIKPIQRKRSRNLLNLNSQKNKVKHSQNESFCATCHEEGNNIIRCSKYGYQVGGANQVYHAEPTVQYATYALVYLIAVYTICCIFGLSFSAGLCWIFTNQVISSGLKWLSYGPIESIAFANLGPICWIAIKEAWNLLADLISRIILYLVNAISPEEVNNNTWW